MAAGIRIRRTLIAAVAVATTAALPLGGGVRAEPQPKKTGIGDLNVPPRTGLSRAMRGDLFGVPPKPAPQKKATPAPAPQPVAPRFPYKYGGWVAVGTHRVHYLQKGNDLIAIGKGETLDGVWRIDALSDERIEVSYVPLGQRLPMLLASLTGETAEQGSAAPAAVASVAHAPARTLSSGRAAVPATAQPAAEPAAAQPATAAPTFITGAIGFPSTAAPAQTAPRSGIGAVTRTASTSEGLSTPGSSAAVPAGKLGVDAPTSGSMPTGPAQGGSAMPIGPAPAGAMPTSPAPTGKLGL